MIYIFFLECDFAINVLISFGANTILFEYSRSVNLIIKNCLNLLITGLLASEFNTTVNDLTPNNVPYEQYSVETREWKQTEIKKKGFANTLFIYEKNDHIFMWKFLTSII